MKRIVIGISGASGVELGLKFVQALPLEIEKYLIISDHAKIVFNKESNTILLDDNNIGAITASGSFKTDAMVIIPCSMNTLAKITHGIADNLLTRTAAVMLKERRPLLLAPREMPFSSIALENMLKLSMLGVHIAPPVLGYYAQNDTLDAMENFLIGKWFDLLGIEHTLFKRWEGA
ncbi:UbiX family flavin prenyltransferase [Sulfurospirillum barnesii]|uniref:Flavin prenyltransferase UbiX n=1 Tax=Sulfurospirillum barnesii (strain ATCC 700032 / DSM 10660 / SES-3) TaxID=760154 RepID=I3XXD7_SULBS|nr:UbiX family flavin prenyltransferase [Sulfurospirillum barnesii]AFL68611.1 polyprenyl p-hydroxybenzoate/phenylacrylic acid decarboxylase [Sulfurospirillum barnesii SES-3]